MIRIFQILTLSLMVLYLTGCKGPEQNESKQEQIKISDLAPSRSGQAIHSRIKTINFDVHIFEMPAENINRLGDLWQMLHTQPLRFNSYKAFKANCFLAGFSPMQKWDMIADELRAAGAQKAATVSLMLPDGQTNDLVVIELSTQQNISFIADDGSSQGARIGPGIFILRLKAEKIPTSRDGCKLIVYPVFTVPLRSPAEELTARVKLREFVFSSAAFGLQMGISDFVILGPERYLSVPSTLDGLVFSKPQGTLFLDINERKTPKLKPAIRIFLFVCSRINY
jgi:hypothetical protein